ncbi:MAG: Nif11-like leader peptide family natural product precursor [bacterium]
MTEPQALRFLRAVHEDAGLRGRIADSHDDLSPEDLVAMGATLGWEFDANDLALAFRHDWTMRRLFFGTFTR